MNVRIHGVVELSDGDGCSELFFEVSYGEMVFFVDHDGRYWEWKWLKGGDVEGRTILSIDGDSEHCNCGYTVKLLYEATGVGDDVKEDVRRQLKENVT